MSVTNKLLRIEPSQCATVDQLVALLGEKWTLLVLGALTKEPTRRYTRQPLADPLTLSALRGCLPVRADGWPCLHRPPMTIAPGADELGQAAHLRTEQRRAANANTRCLQIIARATTRR